MDQLLLLLIAASLCPMIITLFRHGQLSGQFWKATSLRVIDVAHVWKRCKKQKAVRKPAQCPAPRTGEGGGMKKTTQRGRRVTMYIRDSDLVKVRELTAFAAGHGERTSDSLIVRAALLAATPGRRFLTALREVASTDLRFRQE
jgi:hypothetical protein